MSNFYCIAFCSCPSEETAEKIANLLIEKSVAACVNILPKVKSIYKWQGKIESTNEVLLVIKTQQKAFAHLEALIIQNHPYEVPEIILQPIVIGHQPYLRWISDSLSFQD